MKPFKMINRIKAKRMKYMKNILYILITPGLLLFAANIANAQSMQNTSGKKPEQIIIQNNKQETVAPAKNTNLLKQKLIELKNKQGTITGIYKFEQPMVPVDKKEILPEKEKTEIKENQEIIKPK